MTLTPTATLTPTPTPPSPTGQCRATITQSTPPGVTAISVTLSDSSCSVGQLARLHPGGANQEVVQIVGIEPRGAGLFTLFLHGPLSFAHAAGESIIFDAAPAPRPTDTPRPHAADEPDDDAPKETEERRRQRQRTNRSGQDDEQTEGNVVEVRCDAAVPSVVIGNLDGLVEIRLVGSAATRCPSIRVGDYLLASGVKEHEALFEADEVSPVRSRR